MVTLREWQTTLKPRRDLLYNCSIQDGSDSWVPFPIGMGYKLNDYSGNLEDIQLGSHTHTVFCAINTTTDSLRRGNRGGMNRKVIAQTLERNGIGNMYIDATQYFRALPHYKFVVSPEGNGIDCHRHYEALMAGCIPIIERYSGIEEKYRGCPVLWTTDYSEINCDYLNHKYQEMVDKEYDFSRLSMRTYPEPLQEQIRANGNYWGMRLTGRPWYT
jgi:hypothetical protein